MKRKLLVLLTLLAPPVVVAHCPLCTIGAASMAGGAMYLGVNAAIIGIFLGAFAIAIGLWVNRLVPQKIRGQATLLALLSYTTTILPLKPLLNTYKGIPVYLVGGYGTPLNKVYLLNTYLLGTLIGAGILLLSPSISKKLTKYRGKQAPYQGISITFLLLALASLLAQLTL